MNAKQGGPKLPKASARAMKAGKSDSKNTVIACTACCTLAKSRAAESQVPEQAGSMVDSKTPLSASRACFTFVAAAAVLLVGLPFDMHVLLKTGRMTATKSQNGVERLKLSLSLRPPVKRKKTCLRRKHSLKKRLRTCKHRHLSPQVTINCLDSTDVQKHIVKRHMHLC